MTSAPILNALDVRMVSAVTEINDAAILKRARDLCARDGVAWDCLTAAAEGARVLNDRDRRECLMRARDELISEAIEAGTWRYGKPVEKQPFEKRER